MKIVIHVPNWIGDIIFSSPTFVSIKKNFPQSELWIAAREKNKELFSRFDSIKGIIPLSRTNNREKLWESSQKIKAHNFDIGILLTNSFSTALLFFVSRVPQRWGYSREFRGFLLTKKVTKPKRENPVHQVEHYQNLITGLGLHPASPELDFPLSKKEKDWAHHKLFSLGYDPGRPLVFLNPGAVYGSSKRWPVPKFAQLASLLQAKHNAQIFIQGSSKEAELVESIASLMQKKPTLLKDLSLPHLAAIIHSANLFISNDTGPLHIANALKVPVIAIFGPTDPLITGPFNKPSVVLKKEVSCAPCSYRECPEDHKCMEEITPEEVLNASQKYL